MGKYEVFIFLRGFSALIMIVCLISAVLVMRHGSDSDKATAIYYWIAAVIAVGFFAVLGYVQPQKEDYNRFIPHSSEL